LVVRTALAEKLVVDCSSDLASRTYFDACTVRAENQVFLTDAGELGLVFDEAKRTVANADLVGLVEY
jgi:hypothetical protein